MDVNVYNPVYLSFSFFNSRVCGEVGIEKWVLCVTMRMNIPTLFARNRNNQSIIYPELTFYLLQAIFGVKIFLIEFDHPEFRFKKSGARLYKNPLRGPIYPQQLITRVGHIHLNTQRSNIVILYIGFD